MKKHFRILTALISLLFILPLFGCAGREGEVTLDTPEPENTPPAVTDAPETDAPETDAPVTEPVESEPEETTPVEDITISVDDFTFKVGDVLPEGAEMVVVPIDTSAEEVREILDSIAEQGFSENGKCVVYEIHAESEGVKVQPSGAIAVTLPAPIEGVEAYTIYHIKDNGDVDVIEAEAKDGVLSFDIDSFSHFVFAERQNKAIDDSASVSPLVIAVIAAACLALAACIIIVVRKRAK